MAHKIIRVNLDGIDISQHIQDIQFPSPFEGYAEGVENLGPIEISGRWDDVTKDCIVCGGHFVPGPEGTAYLTVQETGERFGPVCHACGTSMLAPS